MVLFHGRADPNTVLPPGLLGPDSGSIETRRGILNEEARKVLENAEQVLIRAGFNQVQQPFDRWESRLFPSGSEQWRRQKLGIVALGLLFYK